MGISIISIWLKPVGTEGALILIPKTEMKTTSPWFGSVSIFRITRNEASSPGRVEYRQHSPSFRAMSFAIRGDPKPMRDSSVFSGFFIGLTLCISGGSQPPPTQELELSCTAGSHPLNAVVRLFVHQLIRPPQTDESATRSISARSHFSLSRVWQMSLGSDLPNTSHSNREAWITLFA